MTSRSNLSTKRRLMFRGPRWVIEMPLALQESRRSYLEHLGQQRCDDAANPVHTGIIFLEKKTKKTKKHLLSKTERNVVLKVNTSAPPEWVPVCVISPAQNSAHMIPCFICSQKPPRPLQLLRASTHNHQSAHTRYTKNAQ